MTGRFSWFLCLSSLTSQMDPSPLGYLEVLRFYVKLVLYFFLPSEYLNMLYFFLQYHVKFKYYTVTLWHRSWMLAVGTLPEGKLCVTSLKANSTQTISSCTLGSREKNSYEPCYMEKSKLFTVKLENTSQVHYTVRWQKKKQTHLEAFNTFLTHFSILTSDFSHQKQKNMLCFCNSIFQTSDFASQRSTCVSQF